jgi:hypothetical protein
MWRPALLIFLLTSLQSAAQGSACGCDDVRDLRNRICEARAAIAEYDRQIARIQDFERDVLKKPLMANEAIYEQCMQPCVQEAINTVSDPNARKATAETDETCEIVFKAPPATSCLRESLLRHERFHQTECSARLQVIQDSSLFGPFLSLFRSVREGQSLVSLATEEKIAYRGEIEHNLAELRRLAANCPRAMFEVERRGRREFTIDYCPPPRPRPEPSACPSKCPLAMQQVGG